MHKYTIAFLLVLSFITLQGASPARPEHFPRTEPFSIIDIRAGGNEYVSDIGHDEGATDSDFNMSYYPKHNPFIVFGQKQASPEKPALVRGMYNEKVPSFADAIAIKTDVSAVHVGRALILLHSKSGNHKNLAFVQDNFFKPFLIEDLYLQQFETILKNQLGNLSSQIKLYEEQATDKSTLEGQRAFQFAKALRQKDDFVRCRMFYLTFDSDGNLTNSEYTFGLPQRTSEKNEAFSDFFKLKKSYRNLTKKQGHKTSTFAFGFACSNCTKEKPGIIQRNVDKLGLLLAAHKYGQEIKKGIKDDAQSSFVMFDLKSANLENKKLEKAKVKEKEEVSRESSDTSEEQSSNTSDEEMTPAMLKADIAVLKEFIDSSEEQSYVEEEESDVDSDAPDERTALAMAQKGIDDLINLTDEFNEDE